jgi:hypothetical protein
MTRVKAEAARSAGTRSVSLEACHSGDYLSGNKSQKASERFMSLEGPSVMSPDTAGALEFVFSSNERFRDVLPVGRDLYVITTNRSPRGDGPSSDRLLRLSPRRG